MFSKSEKRTDIIGIVCRRQDDGCRDARHRVASVVLYGISMPAYSLFGVFCRRRGNRHIDAWRRQTDVVFNSTPIPEFDRFGSLCRCHGDERRDGRRPVAIVVSYDGSKVALG